MVPLVVTFTGFALVALPVILSATAWAAWAMWHLVFGDETSPLDTQSQAEVPTSVELGVSLKRERKRPRRSAVSSRQQVGFPPEPGDSPLMDELWLRRN